MRIHRIKHQNEFVVLATHALRNKELSWAAKGIHSFIMQLPSDWELNLQGLSTCSIDKATATTTGFNELLNAGYVERFAVREKGRFMGYEYNIYEYPIENKTPSKAKTRTERNKSKNGKTEIGISACGKTENGKTENGESSTIKYESNKELKELNSKEISDFDKSQTPAEILFSDTLETEKKKEKKVAAKKERVTIHEIDATEAPEGTNKGLFILLRQFAKLRLKKTRKEFSPSAWKRMVNQFKKVSSMYPVEALKELLEEAQFKVSSWDSPVENWCYEKLNRLTKSLSLKNETQQSNTYHATTKAERERAAFDELKQSKPFDLDA